VAIIRSWRSWIKDQNKMTFTRDSIVGRNANGSFIHHSAPMPLPGFGRVRDAAPTGSTVGGVGTSSAGYAENSRTMGDPRRGKIEDLGRERSDATANVLASWATGSEVEIIEDGALSYLCRWEPLQSGEGRPEGATTENPITRSATTMNDPEKSFADPPVGPRAAQDARIANTFARLRSHDEKPTPQAKRALTNIRKTADALGSINDANAAFWSGKK
jgi:hypothetical protein